MIILYDKNKTNGFDRNDLVLKNTSKCEILWERNGLYKIDLIYPIINGDTAWKSIVKGAIVKCPVAYQEDQLFRLQTPAKKFDNGYFYIEVTGYHITYDLSDNFLEDVRPTNKSGKDAGQYILDNTQFKHPFIWNGNISDVNTAYYIRQNVIDALISDKDNSYVNTWGGELVRDNFNIGILKNGGINNGVVIAYSKNLTGLEQSADDSNLITRAMPTATMDNAQADANGITPVLKLPEKYVDSPLINNYAHPYVKEVQVTFDDTQKSLPDDQKYQIMRDYVNNDLFTKQHVDVPVYSYTINFIDLSQTQEYKNYAILEEVHPMDLITVKALDIDVIAELIGYTYDSLLKKYTTITLGNVRNDILRHNNKSLFQISNNNSNNIKLLQAQIGDLPNAIVNNLDNHVVSGANNLFDHSSLEDKYLTEWTVTGATMVPDDNIHATDKVWQLPPNSSVSKDGVINNPDNFKGQQLVFSLQAKYSSVNILNGGEYQQFQSDVLLGALDMQVKGCIADGKSTVWDFNDNNTGIITDYIAVISGTDFIVTNTQSYYYVLHGYDNNYNFVTDFTAESTIPDGISFMTVEIIQAGITPMTILGFSIYEANSHTVENVVDIYADKTNSDWQTHEQNFYLNTFNPSDIIEAINFRSLNGDSAATAYIGGFMINTGNSSNNYVQSSNDTVETLRAHEVITDYIQAKQADIDQLHATIANVGTLNADVANINTAIIGKADIADLTATIANIDTLNTTIANIGKLNATEGDITLLNAVNGNIQNLISTKANISDLTATYANIETLQADTARINTLLAGNITAANIQANSITADSGLIADGAIADAKILNLSVSKILAGNISTNKFTVVSDSGNLKIQDNTLHVWDNAGQERISLGQNGTDYNLLVRGNDGQTVLFGVDGVTHEGITQGAVDDSNIAVDANISGGKIDMISLFSTMNNSSETLKTSKIFYDDSGQTLDVAFNTLSKTVTETIGDAPYRVEITSTNGGWFRNGQIDTILTAKVFLGFVDVSDTIIAANYTWTRTSSDTAGDDTWNAAHIGYGPQIHVTKDDFAIKADFNCNITSD